MTNKYNDLPELYIVSQVLPVACRSCWMPGAKEVLGCPRKYFLFVYSSPKISDDLFRSFTKIFPIRLLKYFLQHFSLFRISCQISRKFAPLVLLHALVTTFFSFLSFTYICLLKLAPWMPPG